MDEGRVEIHKYLRHRSKKGSACDITCAPIHLFKAHLIMMEHVLNFTIRVQFLSFVNQRWMKMMEKSFSSKNPNRTLPVAFWDLHNDKKEKTPELLCSLCVWDLLLEHLSLGHEQHLSWAFTAIPVDRAEPSDFPILKLSVRSAWSAGKLFLSELEEAHFVFVTSDFKWNSTCPPVFLKKKQIKTSALC